MRGVRNRVGIDARARAGFRCENFVDGLLFIVAFVDRNVVEEISGEIHRAHHLLDKRHLVRRNVVLGVKCLVRPLSIPCLRRNEGIDLACRVL